jgi:hypothetical protein
MDFSPKKKNKKKKHYLAKIEWSERNQNILVRIWLEFLEQTEIMSGMRLFMFFELERDILTTPTITELTTLLNMYKKTDIFFLF